ncbi:MAG: hypothetical protein JW943_00540 [Deltaproteobacteria bacterium]|nr:hypothetical protein [Deltaproteobacteria bacterium]
MKHKKKWSGTIVALICMLSVGCSGGGGGTATTSGGDAGNAAVSAYSSGTVTGFGSIIIDGVRHGTSMAQVHQEINPDAPAPGTIAMVKLGMKVQAMLDAQDRITTLTIQSKVRGKISSLTADGFIVAGQTVVVSDDPAAPTVFEGANGLEDLAVDDFVEVHGSRDASGNIIATRIERKDPINEEGVRVVGPVANLDTTAKTFTIAGLTVDYGSAKLLPAGSTLADGQQVAVWSNTGLTNTTMTAKAVLIKLPQIENGSRVRLGGRISDLDPEARTFSLGGMTVDASTAAFSNGSAGDLANGCLVRIQGVWSGKVVANRITYIKAPADATVELSGVVTDFVSEASFMLRGVLVDASAAVFSEGAAENLANGVMIKIEGCIDGGVVKASSVEFVTISDSGKDNENRIFPGTVSSYNEVSGAFTLANINLAMKINDATVFYNADGSEASKDDFSEGQRVLVRGNLVDGILTAKELYFRPMNGFTSLHVEGVLYALDGEASSFQINGVTIAYTDETVFENGSVSDLANGVRVHVTINIVGGRMVASVIEFQRSGAAMVMALGAISDFVSNANFKVADQQVDAGGSSVMFIRGAAADLANGRVVKVFGTLSGTTLMADRVQFKD